VGCHDGWVYALRAKDGQLAWRTRIAPWEKRLVAYGQVESVWPAIGTVLLHDNVLFAHAGRTTESDGGIALAALSPESGALIWGKALGVDAKIIRPNDLLCVQNGAPMWRHVKIDPKTGSATAGAAPKPPRILMDPTWTYYRGRRTGKAFQLGTLNADIMAWNDKHAALPTGLVKREGGANVWNVQGAGNVEAIAMASNAVAFAGRVTETGKFTGRLLVAAAADGKKLAEFPLDAPPTYDGLAIAHQQVFLSLQNGTLVSFGK
jgi:outer membrane protein assembly factor BamB